MKTTTSTYPLRLPISLKAEAERLSKQEGASLNQFVVLAVAEKISAMETATFFEERAKKGDREVLRRILNRKKGGSRRVRVTNFCSSLKPFHRVCHLEVDRVKIVILSAELLLVQLHIWRHLRRYGSFVF